MMAAPCSLRSQVNLVSLPDNHVPGKIKPSGTTIVVPA